MSRRQIAATRPATRAARQSAPHQSASRALVVRKSTTGLIERLRVPAILGWLILIALMGGGSRGSILSLVALRPLAAVVAAAALIGMTRDQWRHVRWPVGLILGIAALAALQLVPGLGGALPGRTLGDAVAATLGLSTGDAVSQSPTRTWNALFALIVPLSAVLAYARLSPDERPRVVTLLLGFVALSAVLAVFQLVGPRGGPLYFYDVTNVGGAVGLFANRNSQALLLAIAFPLAAAHLLLAVRRKGRAGPQRAVIAALLLLVVPLLLATGSRGGLALAGLGFASVFLFMPAERYPPLEWGRRRIDPRLLAGLVGLIAAPLAVLVSSRIDTIERLADSGAGEDLRVALWEPVGAMIRDNVWLGGGLGSFADVYKRYEPDALLGFSYVNHVHNDWLEFLYEGGLPAAALLIVGIGALGMALRTAWAGRGSVTSAAILQRLGVVLVSMIAVGSLFEYPLRVPSLAAVAAIALAWATGQDRRRAP